MADQIMDTASETSVLVPSIWSQQFYDVLLSELPFSSVVDKSYQSEINNLGDTVKISTVPEFSDAIELAEDAKNDADAVTITQQSLVVNKRVVKDFIVTNKSLLQSIPFVDKLRDLAIYSVMKKIESTIISTSVPSASAPDHQIAYDSGSTLALADILEAKELLDVQDVPMANRHMVMDAPQYNDIYNITNFTSSDYLVAGAPSQTGELPVMLVGFTPHLSTLTSGVTYLFHSSYLTMAIQQGMNVQMYDLGLEGIRGQRVNCDILYGLKLLDNKRIVSIG